MRRLLAVVAVIGLFQATAARAHYLWIEPSGDHLELRFGEYQENLRETGDTRLPEFPAPQGKVLQRGKWEAVPLVREHDGFSIPASRAAIAQDTGVAVKDWTKSNIGIVKPMFYARFARLETQLAPEQTLDLVPRDKDRFALYFRGNPLPGAAVTLIGPDLVEHKLVTDDEGLFVADHLAPGLTVLDAAHLEAVPGSFQGVAYEGIRHRATLAFVREPSDGTSSSAHHPSK